MSQKSNRDKISKVLNEQLMKKEFQDNHDNNLKETNMDEISQNDFYSATDKSNLDSSTNEISLQQKLEEMA